MHLMQAKHLRRQAGFTLVEILVSTLLGSALLVGFHSFSQAQLKGMQNQATQIEVQSVARAMLELIARDIRRGGFDPTCSKTFDGLAVAKVDQVRIRSDLNGNGVIESGEEDVLYKYNNVRYSIERVSGGLTNALLDGVAFGGSSLRYFDGLGNELNPGTAGLNAADRDQVRRVRIELAFADSALNSSQPLRARVATDVDLRNRYFLANTTCP